MRADRVWCLWLRSISAPPRPSDTGAERLARNHRASQRTVNPGAMSKLLIVRFSAQPMLARLPRNCVSAAMPAEDAKLAQGHRMPKTGKWSETMLRLGFAARDDDAALAIAQARLGGRPAASPSTRRGGRRGPDGGGPSGPAWLALAAASERGAMLRAAVATTPPRGRFVRASGCASSTTRRPTATSRRSSTAAAAALRRAGGRLAIGKDVIGALRQGGSRKIVFAILIDRSGITSEDQGHKGEIVVNKKDPPPRRPTWGAVRWWAARA